jgi:hypothetical protein
LKIILIEREEEKKRKEEEYKQIEQKKIEYLAKLAQQVPYWDAIQNVSSKLDYITAAAKTHEYIKGEDFARGYMPLNGFT